MSENLFSRRKEMFYGITKTKNISFDALEVSNFSITFWLHILICSSLSKAS